MATNIKSALKIKCPHCGNKFSPEAALEHDVRLHLEKEFEKKFEETSKTLEQSIKRREQEKFKTQLTALEEDRLEKAALLQELQEKSIAVDERERQLREKESQIELELRKEAS